MVRKMSVCADDDQDIIDVDVSDDEKYNSDNVFQGLWIPYPDQVAKMFEKLDKGGVPVLKWRCPGRRPPEVEKEEEDMETDLNLAVEPKQEEQKEEKKVPQATEFDFDDTSLETSTKLTPRKTPGSSKGKKRVARMDKVLDDLIRQRKATEATKDQRKKASPKTPRGGGAAAAGGRFFSSPRTPGEKYSPTISPVSTPRGSSVKSPPNRLLGAKYAQQLRPTCTSPRAPSSPKNATSGEKTPTSANSPVGSAKMSPIDKEPSPNAAKVSMAEPNESTVKMTCASMATSPSNTAKFTPLTQALMSEPMVSSPLSDNSLFNKPRNSLPQVMTHPLSNTVTTITTTANSSVSAPIASSSLATNSPAQATTHQHLAAAQTVGGQRPSFSLFTHQNSVAQGSPQAGIARVTQPHVPNSPLAQTAQSPHAHSPLSQPAHSPMTHTSQSPLTQLSQSPLSQPVPSPLSQTTHSPISQPIQSPLSQHSQSPMTQLAHSPMAQHAQSPMSQPAQSPTAQSPLAQTAQSPSASHSPISQVCQLRSAVPQNIPNTKPRLTLSGKPWVSVSDKPKLTMANKPRLSLASPLTVSTSTIQSHLSSTPTLQAQLNQAVQHRVLQQHLSQTTPQQTSQILQQQRAAQALSQQQQQISQPAVAQQHMVSVTESAQTQLSQPQQQLTQQLQLNQQSQIQLSQQQQLAQQQQQLAQQQLSQQQQLQQLNQQQVQTQQLTPQQQQQLTLALAQQQLNQHQQTGNQSMSPQMAQQLSQLIKQQRIQLTLRQQRAAQQQQQQQQLAQVKAQQLVSTQQLIQQPQPQLSPINVQQMAQTTSQAQLVQSTAQTSQAPTQLNVTTASAAPKVWSKPSAQHQLLQAALSQGPQNQMSLSQMIQAVKSRMNPITHPQLFKSLSQLTQTNQPQINQSPQLHVNHLQGTLASSSPSLSTLVMASQSPTTSSTPTHSSTAVPFHSSDIIQNPSQASGHLTQVVYQSQTPQSNPSHIGPPPTTSITAQAVLQQPSSAITQPSLLVRKDEAIPAHQTQLGIPRNESTDYKLSIFTQASTLSTSSVTATESVPTTQFVLQAQVSRADPIQALSRQLPNVGRKVTLSNEASALSTQLSASEAPMSQPTTIVGQSSQIPTTQTRFVPSNLLQTNTESALLTRERLAAPVDTSNQERFTLATMGQTINRTPHPPASQASELPSPSSREHLTLASMLPPFDLAGLSQQDKQTLSTITQSRDLSYLQNCTTGSDTMTGTTQPFSTVNKTAPTVSFPQSNIQIGEPQASSVSQSYIMPTYGVSSAMIGKPPPPYSVAIAEKALSSMRTSMAGRKDTNIISQLPSSSTVTSIPSTTDKNVMFIKKNESSLPSTTVTVWPTIPSTASEIATNVVSSQSPIVTAQLGVGSVPTASVQKIPLQQTQQLSTIAEIKTQAEKDDKQTLDLVNTSLSTVRSAISMSNQLYPQAVSKENLLVRKNLLGFSALNKPSTASDVTTSSTSTIAANNSLLQHMLGTSTSDHLTTTSTPHFTTTSTPHLISSVSTQELNLQKISLNSASVTSSSSLGTLNSSLSLSQPTSTTTSTRPRLTTIAALLNIDSGPKTQAELQLRQLSMAGLAADGSSAISNLGQTLSIISPITSFSSSVTKTVNPSSISAGTKLTIVPALSTKPNITSQVTTTSAAETSQTEQLQTTPVSEP